VFRFVDEGIQQTIAGYQRQNNALLEGVLAPLNQILQTTDTVWRGVGAEAFKQDLANVHVNQTNIFSGMLQEMVKNLTQTTDIIKQADQTAKGLVNAFGDEVSKITQGL
jgi:uncharacterized protein YukE